MDLRDLLSIRRLEKFPGWNKYKQQFKRNIKLLSFDRFYIFNIYGEANVGKTYLLDQFRCIAQENGVSYATVGKEFDDVPSVMGKIYEDLRISGASEFIFETLYSNYVRLRSELVSNPSRPKYTNDFLGGNLLNIDELRISPEKDIAKRINTWSTEQDWRQSEEIKDTVSELAKYIESQILESSDRKLIENPIDELTPDFLSFLNETAKANSVVLFFDDYHINKVILDEWLRDLVSPFRYGKGLPGNIILVISGHEKIDREKWSLFDSFIIDVNLKKFVSSDISKILDQKGINDEESKRLIENLTGGMPVHLKNLLMKLGKKQSISEEAILNCFLEDIKTSRQRIAMLSLAIPRFFTRRIFEEILNPNEGNEIFDWITAMPCLNHRSGEWMYDHFVRKAMIKHKQGMPNFNPSMIHENLASFYERADASLISTLSDLQEDDPKYSRYNNIHEKYIVELCYHKLCVLKEDYLVAAINIFLETFMASPRLSGELANAMLQASEDSGFEQAAEHAKQLFLCLESYENKNMLALLNSFETMLSEWNWLDNKARGKLQELMALFSSRSELDEDLEENSIKDYDQFSRRSELFSLISGLPQSQFEQLLFALKLPSGIVPGSQAPQGSRVYALLEWSESHNGYGLEVVSSALELVSSS